MRRRRRPPPLRLLAGLACLLLLAISCSGVRYLSQSVVGGARILLARQPIERLLEDPDLDPLLRRRLEMVLEIRSFAADRLDLPVGQAYSSYVEVERPFVAWNVVAAPPDSVEPRTWCFPVAGCVSYRGYFSEPRAQRYAQGLREEGWDVDVGGVTAYSTLGWFADPVLGTFIDLPESQLAGLLFHELAHRRLYVAGDTAFNESFASFVEERGEAAWLEGRDRGDQVEAALRLRRRERTFLDLVLGARSCLEQLYAEGLPEEEMEHLKAEEFDALRSRYAAVRERWLEEDPAGPVYDAWFAGELNNAHVAAVGDYSIWLDAFGELYRRAGSLADFYAAAADLADLGAEERLEALEALAPARSPDRTPCVTDPPPAPAAPDRESP